MNFTHLISAETLIRHLNDSACEHAHRLLSMPRVKCLVSLCFTITPLTIIVLLIEGRFRGHTWVNFQGLGFLIRLIDLQPVRQTHRNSVLDVGKAEGGQQRGDPGQVSAGAVQIRIHVLLAQYCICNRHGCGRCNCMSWKHRQCRQLHDNLHVQ